MYFASMLKLSAAVFFLISGVIAIDGCDKPFSLVCRGDNAPEKFPETKEELRSNCDFAIDFFKCGAEYAERCNQNGAYDELNEILRIFQEVCNEDTLLFAAIVDNLKCFNEIVEDEENHRECYRSPNSSSVARYVESLEAEGLITPNDDNTGYPSAYVCMHALQDLACYATKIERKCGTIAMDTFIEILHKTGPVIFECGENLHLLPAVIQLYKLEEQEANEIAEIFKRRK